MESYHVPRTTIMRPIQELVHSVRRIMISFYEFVQTGHIECADGLREVSINHGVLQVKNLAFVIFEDPRHHRVLSEISHASLGVGIQQH